MAKTRAACIRLVEAGGVRLNRQPAEKPHARLRPGDVLTLALGSPERGHHPGVAGAVLAARRGPPTEARGLYEDLSEQA